MKHFGGDELFALTVSCDDAIVKDNEIYQCACIDKDGNQVPACGSGLLSVWASEMVGIENRRKYYLKDKCPDDLKRPIWKDQDYKYEYNIEEILQRVAKTLLSKE